MSIHDGQMDGAEGAAIATVDAPHSPLADGGIVTVLCNKQFSSVYHKTHAQNYLHPEMTVWMTGCYNPQTNQLTGSTRISITFVPETVTSSTHNDTAELTLA